MLGLKQVVIRCLFTVCHMQSEERSFLCAPPLIVLKWLSHFSVLCSWLHIHFNKHPWLAEMCVHWLSWFFRRTIQSPYLCSMPIAGIITVTDLVWFSCLYQTTHHVLCCRLSAVNNRIRTGDWPHYTIKKDLFSTLPRLSNRTIILNGFATLKWD